MSYVKLRSFLLWLWGRQFGENGQTLAEFTFIVALVALVAVLALSALGMAVAGFFDSVVPAFGG
jgi:Flp pilus assembly pilin Flp